MFAHAQVGPRKNARAPSQARRTSARGFCVQYLLRELAVPSHRSIIASSGNDAPKVVPDESKPLERPGVALRQPNRKIKYEIQVLHCQAEAQVQVQAAEACPSSSPFQFQKKGEAKDQLERVPVAFLCFQTVK